MGWGEAHEPETPLPTERDTYGEVRPFSDLRPTGLLWLINRSLLHPRGYALALHYPEDATTEAILAGEVEPIGWSIEGDGTETWRYDDDLDEDERFARIKELLP